MTLCWPPLWSGWCRILPYGVHDGHPCMWYSHPAGFVLSLLLPHYQVPVGRMPQTMASPSGSFICQHALLTGVQSASDCSQLGSTLFISRGAYVAPSLILWCHSSVSGRAVCVYVVVGWWCGLVVWSVEELALKLSLAKIRAAHNLNYSQVSLWLLWYFY